MTLFLVPPAWLVHHVYFDRSGLPDLEPFVRFEPPTTGVVRDTRGEVLIELAREYRRVVAYEDVPPILRQAIMAAEDRRFFEHAGVDYHSLPRVIQKTVTRSLGASEVRLLELADAYRAIASGIAADPHVIDRVTDLDGALRSVAPYAGRVLRSSSLSLLQEGLRGVIRIPGGTANTLDHRDFPIQVMGKTGTTSDFRDALFVGSTYGPDGITVAVRLGFDDNRSLGGKETGGRAALPVFREIMLRVHQAQLAGPTPRFPRTIEHRIDRYLAERAALNTPPAHSVRSRGGVSRSR